MQNPVSEALAGWLCEAAVWNQWNGTVEWNTGISFFVSLGALQIYLKDVAISSPYDLV